MEGNAFFTAAAVLLRKETTKPQAGKTPWVIAHFAVANPETDEPSDEKLMRQGAEGEALDRMKPGDCVTLSYELIQGRLGSSYPKCNGFTPTKAKAKLVIK